MLQKAKKRARVYSKLLYRKIKQNKGATAIEYGLIAALIAVVCIVALQTVGTQISARYSRIASAVSAT